jgi:hypothetical protein
MQDPYEEEDYDEDYHDYDHPSANPYQWYFKFDISQDSPISSWINDIINDYNILGNQPIPNWLAKKFPVSSWNPNTVNNKFQYLGSNYAGEPIWKSKYFVCDTINLQYKQHIQANAAYFLQQPSYYKGLQDILN